MKKTCKCRKVSGGWGLGDLFPTNRITRAKRKWQRSDRPKQRQIEKTNRYLKETKPFKD